MHVGKGSVFLPPLLSNISFSLSLSLILFWLQFLDDHPAVRFVVEVRVNLVELAVPELRGPIPLNGCKLHLFTRRIKRANESVCLCVRGCFISANVVRVCTRSAFLSNRASFVTDINVIRNTTDKD